MMTLRVKSFVGDKVIRGRGVAHVQTCVCTTGLSGVHHWAVVLLYIGSCSTRYDSGHGVSVRQIERVLTRWLGVQRSSRRTCTMTMGVRQWVRTLEPRHAVWRPHPSPWTARLAEVSELKTILADVYGSDATHNQYFNKALRKLERVSLSDGSEQVVPIAQFVELARQSPSMLFPAFRVQQKVGRATSMATWVVSVWGYQHCLTLCCTTAAQGVRGQQVLGTCDAAATGNAS